MNKLLILAVFIFSQFVLAQEGLDILLKNDREAKSFHIGKRQQKKLKKLYQQIDKELIAENFKSLVNSSNISTICAFNIVNSLQSNFADVEVADILLSVRDQNLVDDISYSILAKNLEISEYIERDPTVSKRISKLPEEKKKSILRILTQFSVKVDRGACPTSEYKSLYAELRSIVAEKKDQKIKSIRLMQIFDFALNTKAINLDTFKLLERLSSANVQLWSTDLSEYLQKKNQIRIQFPIRAQSLNSDFVTVKAKKMKSSLRMRLYESYDYIQMAMMADVVKKLRRRLDSDKIQINVFNDQTDLEPEEVISLDPMERFRFALKLLQKEMHELSINTFFNGRKPTYTDLMVASFELGIVPAEELDEVASLEEIWNPKKSLWDKAQIWVTSILSISAIVIPPPYGFIPSLAIVAIQATSQNKEEAEYEHSLF